MKNINMDNLENFIQQNRDDFDKEVPKLNLWDKIEKGIEEKPDKLESYIEENRSEFDTETPSAKIWKAIEGRLSGGKVVRMTFKRYIAVAAVALLLLSVGGFMGQYLATSGGTNVAEATFEGMAPEVAEMEDFYAMKISEKVEELKNISPDDAVLKDLEEMETQYKEIKKELLASEMTESEFIIRALIDNLQTRMEILEKVLQRIESVKSLNTIENESI